MKRSDIYPHRIAATGFSVVELLVVIAMVLVLVGLLVGGLATARFRARVTVCANHFRQWGIAANLYAQEDRQQRLPSFPLPLEKFANKRYGDLAPWFVSLQMGTNLSAYGVSLPLWFCPAKRNGRGFQLANEHFKARHPGQTLTTVEELTEVWREQAEFFGAIDYCWWVPRPLTGSTEVYPDPKLCRSRVPDGWPTRLEDPAGASQPILTDWALGSWNDDLTEVEIQEGNGGHEFPAYRTVRSLNALFVDGRVETRKRKELNWQIQTGRHAVLY
ncbi:MAG TPA: hypothetical protein PLX89_05915 [Verrucomicrobiota bacterium]|nr:hypothetical protein [Verrucomicrobiota bacterium]